MIDKKIADQIQWPCDLTFELKKQLIQIAEEKNSITEGGINEFDSVAKGVCYLQKGVATICMPSKDMRALMGSFIGPKQWFGATVIDSNRAINLIVEEVEPVSLLLFPADKILQLAKKDNEVYKWLYFIAKKAQPIWLQASITALHDIQTRIVYAILELVALQPKMTGVLPKINISQRQLSQITGVSRPRLNEVLKRIQQEGEIEVQRGYIQLLDIKALQLRLHNLSEAFSSQPKRGKDE